MINSQDIKKGTCIRLDGKLYFCVDFMNQETFDDIIIDKNLINGVDFMIEGQIVEVVSDASTETVLFADMPVKVQLKVTYTEPGIKGDTATNTLKPATVESGAEVRVPLFIEEVERYCFPQRCRITGHSDRLRQQPGNCRPTVTTYFKFRQ